MDLAEETFPLGTVRSGESRSSSARAFLLLLRPVAVTCAFCCGHCWLRFPPSCFCRDPSFFAVAASVADCALSRLVSLLQLPTLIVPLYHHLGLCSCRGPCFPPLPPLRFALLPRSCLSLPPLCAALLLLLGLRAWERSLLAEARWASIMAWWNWVVVSGCARATGFSGASVYGDEAVDVLNRCLAATMDWMGANKLRLNPDKTEMLLVDGFSDRMMDIYPILDGVTLPLKEQGCL
ncbi:uncharacterized protein LOC133378860 [Rhineura floridana]|uniref:uncharacterized protein LOC133378860 n=1 Tax=Rhineura floridana TaxID=261503 RepID=UPI002AC87139|nr:uncharacterized protein LOC133378860 [Rhineura floridana]